MFMNKHCVTRLNIYEYVIKLGTNNELLHVQRCVFLGLLTIEFCKRFLY